MQMYGHPLESGQPTRDHIQEENYLSCKGHYRVRTVQKWQQKNHELMANLSYRVYSMASLSYVTRP